MKTIYSTVLLHKIPCQWLLFGLLGLLGSGSGWAQSISTQPQAPASLPAPGLQTADPGRAARKALLSKPSVVSALALRQAAAQARTQSACFEPLDRATYTALAPNDDDSMGPIALGFTFSLFGSTYTSCYVNNNGNVSFGQGIGEYNAQGFPYATPMVAPFWADVDTRAPGSGQVWYKVYPDRLVVTWDQVGYYTAPASITPLRNTFQVVIRKNTGADAPNPDVSFAYGDMQWSTGNASGGLGGFAGNPATVGVNQGGTSGNYIGTGRFNQNDATPPQATYPANTTVFSGVNWLDNQCIGYTSAPAGNLPPTATGFPTNNILTLSLGQTVSLPLQFAGPEANQSISVVPALNGLCNTTAVVGSGANPIVNFSVTGDACNVGSHTVSFVATDNGTPVQSQTFALTVVVRPTMEWTGSLSTAYTLPGNWSGGVVPGAGDDVNIPAGVPRFPLLTASVEAVNFTVATGASMTIGTGGELNLTGNVANNGTFEGALGALRAVGGTSKILSGNGIALGELTVSSSGLALDAGLRIGRLLVLNGNLVTNGYPLQLLSNASGTAMVVNNGSAVVVGTAEVQRYVDPALNGLRGYRHFAAPVAGATIGSLTSSCFSPTLNPSYNTQGSTASPFPTVFGYDQSRVSASGSAGSADFDQGFFSPNSTGDAFADTKGYTVNIAPLSACPGSPASLRPVTFSGLLHNGNYSTGALPRGAAMQAGWHLLGNPYPAPIDWDAAFAGAAGLDNAVYVFKSSGPYAGTYDPYVNGVGPARYIGVAQAFFVRTSAAGTSGQLNFTNDARVTSYLNPTFNRTAPGAGDQRPQLRLDLASNGQTDATYVYFQNGATTGFDRQYDAFKLPGGSPLYLATGTGSPAYSINGQPALGTAGAALPLMAYLPQAGSFSLSVGELKNFSTATLQLEDRQTGIWHNLRQQPSLTFQASRPDEAVARFVLHINQNRVLASKGAVLASEAVSVWPNPASGVVNLTVAALPATPDALHLTLLNSLGQVVLRQTTDVRSGQAAATLAVQALAPGVYTLKGNTSAATFTRSVVVQ